MEVSLHAAEFFRRRDKKYGSIIKRVQRQRMRADVVAEFQRKSAPIALIQGASSGYISRCRQKLVPNILSKIAASDETNLEPNDENVTVQIVEHMSALDGGLVQPFVFPNKFH